VVDWAPGGVLVFPVQYTPLYVSFGWMLVVV